MEKTKVWYTVRNLGDGSVGLRWHLSKEAAEKSEQEEEDSGYNFAESTVDSVETFFGSDIHKEATKNELHAG